MKVKDFLEVYDDAYLIITDSNNKLLYNEDPNEDIIIDDAQTLEKLASRTIDIISSGVTIVDGTEYMVFYIQLK